MNHYRITIRVPGVLTVHRDAPDWQTAKRWAEGEGYRVVRVEVLVSSVESYIFDTCWRV